MRVLWFSLTPSCYSKAKGLGYNGGGWIASLQEELMKRSSIELGITFIKGRKKFVDQEQGVKYYIIPSPTKKIKDKINFFFDYRVESELKYYTPYFKEVVNDFKPDIIQVFGSESILGFIQQLTNIPCVLHLQGILNPYWNAFLPPSISKNTFIFKKKSPKKVLSAYKEIKTWENNCTRERELFKEITYFIGRTEWDNIITKTLNPNAQYFYCSEILRKSFYEECERVNPQKMIIVSTISGVIYKGIDLILKTASILKQHWNKDFEWIVYGGTSNVEFFERLTGIKAKDVNITLKGVATEETIRNALLNATVFAQTSYIDNSPNAVCEAQICGCPVVACNVGGVSSLINHKETGMLVPANAPYQMAANLHELYVNKNLNNHISINGKKIAQIRHNKGNIIQDLMNIYRYVINTIKKSEYDKNEKRP